MLTPKDLSVLIVDDNEYACILTETELKGLGVDQIFRTTDVVSGLDILAKEKIDLVFLDWYMPDINGAGMIALMRWHKHGIPVIITTAYATTDNVRRFHELALDHIMVKPFGRRELVDMIGKVLAVPLEVDNSGEAPGKRTVKVIPPGEKKGGDDDADLDTVLI